MATRKDKKEKEPPQDAPRKKDDGRKNIIANERFIIRRNDPFDNYKPNSDDAIAMLATTPISQPLAPDEAAMLREVAADMDLSLPLDEIEDFPAKTSISDESKVQLARMPTWLRSMIGSRWEVIHKHYGHGAHKFLKVIANRIEHQYRNQYLKTIGASVDVEDEAMPIEEVYEGFDLLNEAEEAEEVNPSAPSIKKRDPSLRVAHLVGKFKVQQHKKRFWEPYMIKIAESCLRTAMVTRATVGDMAILAAERDIEEVNDAHKHDEYEYDSEEEIEAQGKQKTKRKVHRGGWEIIDEEGEIKAEAKETIESRFHEKNELKLSRTEQEKEKMKNKMKKVDKKNKKVGCWSYLKHHPLFVAINMRKEKKKYLLERALYRRYSRIWYKGCGEPIESKKLGHQFRIDEEFHEYIVSLVTWMPFKYLIMFIILANACLLALETQKSLDKFQGLFEQLDNIFLSVYTVEFILKIYAHPYQYWKSGYNIFDFIILVISLAKVIIDTLGVAEITFLRLLLIVRALRILRGVSMSVQLQVLVTALVETVKTHVLSVVILLVLCMYIAAVVAFYLFSHTEGLKKPWGNVALGMLRMFSFVTMDGWTDITRRFERSNMYIEGRIFGLTGIVLGNFLFSSIFIAIIILNISEATDTYRDHQREEGEILVNQKKDLIFRRQNLTMRQLLARQRVSISTDFFHISSQFQHLLRHDDLVAMQDICTSPLWIDCLYKTFARCHHTANMLMNIHREVADTLLECYKFYGDGRYKVEPIARARYNRYMKIKAKLALIKKEIYRHRKPEPKKKLRIRFPKDDNNDDKNVRPTQSNVPPITPSQQQQKKK